MKDSGSGWLPGYDLANRLSCGRHKHSPLATLPIKEEGSSNLCHSEQKRSRRMSPEAPSDPPYPSRRSVARQRPIVLLPGGASDCGRPARVRFQADWPVPDESPAVETRPPESFAFLRFGL